MLARLTATTQSERFDLDCRRELLHARTIAGAFSSTQHPASACPRPQRPRQKGARRRAGERTLVIHAQQQRHRPPPMHECIHIPPIWRCIAPSPKLSPAPQEFSACLAVVVVARLISSRLVHLVPCLARPGFAQ